MTPQEIPPNTPPESPPTGTFSVLAQVDFRWLFLGNILANAAQWIQGVTMSWIVYEWTSSGTLLGSLNLVSTFATLGLAPLAGVAIDRISRRRLMLFTNTWFLAINLALGLTLLSGLTRVWPLFLFTLLGGMALAIDQPLRQTVLFTLVPRKLAPNAVALLQTGWATMRTLGPTIGGALLLWIGPGGNFLVQAGAFALIIWTVLYLVFPPMPEAEPKTATFSNLKRGLGYVMGDANTRTFFLMGWILSLFTIPIFVVMPAIYASDIFQGGPEVLGYLLSAIGVGGVVAGLVVVSLKRVDRRGLVGVAGLLGLSLSLAGFAMSANLWLSLLLLALAGFCEMVFIITNQTLLQLSIPDELRGRVNGIITLSNGLVPIGSLIAGAGADWLGPRLTTLLLSAAASLVSLVALFTSRTLREYRLSRGLDG
jgi:MFS transporter, DHA1 family, staphyloferrin A biosynthesis exporter